MFDGMESWLPWLVDDDVVITDLVPADGLIVLVEPKRIRDRAREILAEEIDLAASLARTWDVDSIGMPRPPHRVRPPPVGSHRTGVDGCSAWPTRPTRR